MKEKIIHFGEFVRWQRVRSGKTTEALGREIGLTARRLIAIEAMAKPDIQHTTMAALAKVFNIDPEEFDTVWQNTPVPVTRRKPGPTTDEARRFTIACLAAGVPQAEAMRNLRSWIIEQNEATQIEALGFMAPHRQGDFTQAVDHLQDPAEAVKNRVGKATAKATPESAAKDESTHH